MKIHKGIYLTAAVVSIVVNISQYMAANKAQVSADESKAALISKQADLANVEAANAALMTISLPGFLRTYNDHVEELRATADAFEKAMALKELDIPGSEAADKVAHAQSDLFIATDIFTDFADRWRDIAQSLDQLLDGNVTQLKNSRSENKAEDVDAVARRIVSRQHQTLRLHFGWHWKNLSHLLRRRNSDFS